MRETLNRNSIGATTPMELRFGIQRDSRGWLLLARNFVSDLISRAI
jgi:hypothetical protein